MSPEPYYSDSMVTLYLGDMREVLPRLDVTADACITDPPYGETSLAWDRWPDGWPALVAAHTRSLWCFGSMTMFFARLQEIAEAGWRMSQDVVWEKHNGSGFATDRFKRVHEHAIHWYRGQWRDVYHETPRPISHARPVNARAANSRTPHTGVIGAQAYEDDGRRLVRSVIKARSMHGRAIHPTEKPAAVLAPLIEYSVHLGGLVLDPFAGSASTLLTARSLGRRAIGIEASETYCEKAAKRLSEPDLFGGVA